MRIRPLLTLPLLVAGGSLSLSAAEGDAPADEIAPEDEPQGWTYKGQIGGFFTSVATHNTEDSRDASINGSTESINYLLSFDGRLDWRRDLHSVEQTLILKFGRQKEEDRPWVENTDEIDYDGAYKYHLGLPHFVYGAWGADSVFTGPEPDEYFLDPFTGKVSAGYGQEHHWQEPDRRWEWRVGVRGQKKWGRNLSEEEREFESGPEFMTRYESTPIPDLTWWIQYEAFSRFDDLGHITNLLTADFNYKLLKYLTLKLSLRAYYETEPDDAETDVGYDEVSWRQDTLLGITYDL